VAPSESEQAPRTALAEVAVLFLRLGFTAFGGPAAHIAMMRDEVVKRRHWVTEQQFLDMLGVCNLIPGPTSTEMAIYLGYIRAGWRGLVLGGALFILPAMAIVLAIAWAYVRFGSTPGATALLYGIKPVIIAIILQALWGLGRAAVKGPLLAAMGIAVTALFLVGANPIALLLGGGAVAALAYFARRRLEGGGPAALLLPLSLPSLGAPSAALVAGSVAFSLGTLFLTFLKIGALVYGSGYVLLAFLRDDLVYRLGWLTDQQLIDAVAVGQFTPGPLFTTATFIGYVVGGLPGAVVATVAIFLPGFVLIAALYSIAPRLRKSPWTGALLDGVNVAAVGLIAGITVQLGQAALVDVLTVALAVVAAGALIRFKVNSAWLVLGGAVAGLLSGVWR
jgi:chromate transporter